MASGFIENPFDPRDVWEDEVLSGMSEPLPTSFKTQGLLFEPQGAWPMCVSFCVSKMMEEAIKKQEGIVWDLSQPQLFFQSGGSLNGSFFRANLEEARKGAVSYATLPMPDDLYDLSPFDSLRSRALQLPPESSKAVPGYVRISTDRDSIKKAILNYGMVLVGVSASGGYWADRAKRPVGREDDHATLLVGWDVDDAWFAFDSLQPKRDFDGYHTFDKDYGFGSVFAITGIPSDWKALRDAARQPPPGNAARYGKPRDYQAEIAFAAKMLSELKRFKNQSVLDAAGRFWDMLIRAGVYGGYSLSYTRWFQWQPGDIINDLYLWRRTGQHAFDFDKPRNEQ